MMFSETDGGVMPKFEGQVPILLIVNTKSY
jgi:hypothetical protein